MSLQGTFEQSMVAGVWDSPWMGPPCFARGGSPERLMPENKRSPRMGPSLELGASLAHAF
ncbi:hypothetical protein RESH_04308 [Rhodopirellula europaea SH398]|uniref:Uncharacterized protein n=1 Tax=Rhodopirellula europaea SH398 TaxID=1263868 RepID=M5SBS3_9BACT|nr:hypothetical protein RESH_04308 [Rhodopirellula europaea SH398]